MPRDGDGDDHCFKVELKKGLSESSLDVDIEPCKVWCEQTDGSAPQLVEPEYETQPISGEDFALTVGVDDTKKLYFKHTLSSTRGVTTQIDCVLLDSEPTDGVDGDGSTPGNFEWVHVADLDTTDGARTVTQILKGTYFWPTGGTGSSFSFPEWWSLSNFAGGEIDIGVGLVLSQTVESNSAHADREWQEWEPGPFNGLDALNGLNVYWVVADLTAGSEDVLSVDTDTGVSGVEVEAKEWTYGATIKTDFTVARTATMTPPNPDTRELKHQMLGYFTVAGGAITTPAYWRTNHAVDFRMGAFVVGSGHPSADTSGGWLPTIG